MNPVNLGYRLAYNLVYPFVRPVWWLLGRDLVGVYVALWHEGRILAIKNSYKPEYGLPGGMVDKGESPAQAGARELREEVGVELAEDALEHVYDIVDNTGKVKDHAYVMAASWTGEPPTVTIDHREVVWADFVTPQELLERRLPRQLRKWLDTAAREKGLIE